MEEHNLSISPARTTQASSLVSNNLRRIRHRLTFPPPERILESPNHKASIEKNIYRIPDGSEALSPNSRDLEISWNSRFNVTFSKDNEKVYTKVREYFDSPRKFEEGIRRGSNMRNRKNKQKMREVRVASAFEERENKWNTRYLAENEWNEIKHKNMRNYFGKLPRIA